jgi:oligopeptide transport system substrate-binding protein
MRPVNTMLRWLGAVLLLGLAPLPCASAAADPDKVLRIAFDSAETGFDPARVSDLHSEIVNGAIFETLLTYDWLARPAKLVPMAAARMPEVLDDGRTLRVAIRPGVRFADDAAFGGRPRELTAADFAYSLKRLVDPANRSPSKYLLEGRIEGLDALARAAAAGPAFDYDAPVAGLQIVDRYTLRIRLTRPDPNFLFVLAEPATGAVAREVIERYAGDTLAHPVGTNAYRLERWVRGSRIVLAANPAYRGFVWDFAGSGDPRDATIVATMRGRHMPAIGRVDIAIIEEPQSAWLAFQGGQLDLINLPHAFTERALDADNRLLPELAARGIGLDRSLDAEIQYTFLNPRDPVIGGHTPARIALRRAILMAYDVDEEIRVLRKGQAQRAHFIAPPAAVGHDAEYRSSQRFDPQAANALLDRFDYRRGADGQRMTPEGRPLVFTMYSSTASIDRERDELWARAMQRIGVRLAIRKDKFGELLKQAKQCRLSAWSLAWIAGIPDAGYFMQALYGGNVGRSNNGCFQLPEFDHRYEATLTLADGPERRAAYRELQRLVEYHAGWLFGTVRQRNQLHLSRLLGYRRHPVLHANFMYLDLDR